MSVVELHPEHDCWDIVKALRNIADDIERGAYSFEPTLAVVVLGRETERYKRDGPALNYEWQTHGLGKVGYFSGKGLLAAATAHFETAT